MLTKGKETSRNSINSFQLLETIRPLYILPADAFDQEVLIPGFQNATQVDCMVGFFSSEVLASLAPGLATYINNSKSSFRLIISPLLREVDLQAIEQGIVCLDTIVTERIEELFVTEELLERHTLKCLSWLIRSGKIEIKVALMKNALFHPKVWLFHSEDNLIVAHGSSNVTYSGIKKNIEQIAVSKSWEDSNQRYIAEKLNDQFDRFWDGKEDICIVIPMPEAICNQLLKTYSDSDVPTENEYYSLYDRANNLKTDQTPVKFTIKSKSFSIPPELTFEVGSFAHQGKAVNAWCDAGFRGILEMATGSGKTITAMICAYRLYERHKPLLIVVAAPYLPLIEQWCDEIQPFGITPTNLTNSGSSQKRAADLQKIKRRISTEVSTVEAIIVSHDTLCTPDFLNLIDSFDCAKLLIADEAHNLGSPSFINNQPEFFDFRLALSATPVRQYDPEGTAALLDFFGPVVFQFTLEEAIGKCLVEYEYYVHPVYLTDLEMDQWLTLTDKIRQNAWRSTNNKPDDFLTKLFRDRRAILEMAEGKLVMLKSLLDRENLRSLQHTLIYATDKGPTQLESINQLLNDKGVLFHQLTAEETKDREKTKRIIKSFQRGEIQILTAKRVLDEGVNIPQIRRAYILASTTVQRQWIQRRGRLLRKCKSIGKTISVIHDFLALPPGINESLDPDARELVKSEINRALEFARLANNAGRTDGPQSVLKNLIDAVYPLRS